MKRAGLKVALLLSCIGMPAVTGAQNVPINLVPGEVLLSVERTGVARSKPDVMTITAGVVATGRTAREALATNSALAEKLVAVVHDRGIASEDVRTEELTVDPQIDPADSERAEREGRSPRIIGYVAKNTVELRLRDLGQASELLDAFLVAGANSVHGPTFSMSDPKPVEQNARRAAVAEAREEADTYAAALGMRVARVLRVSERGDFDWEGGNGIVVTGSRIRRTPIEPGELKTRITVWIDYALMPR